MNKEKDTENILTDIAQMIKDRENESIRKENIERATRIFSNLLQRNIEKEMKEIGEKKLTDKFHELHIQLQPICPKQPLVTAQEIMDFMPDVRVNNFPDLDFEAIPGGIFRLQYNRGNYNGLQIYTMGLIENIRKSSSDKVYISHIAESVLITLLVAKNFYQKIEYQGEVIGEVTVKNAKGLEIDPIVLSGRYIFPGGSRIGLLPIYNWDIKINTSDLNEAIKLKEYFIKKLKEIYWSFGYKEEIQDTLIESFLKDRRLLQ